MPGHAEGSPPGVVVIANPAAGRGRGGAMLPRLRRALQARGPHVLHLTTRAGEEAALAQAAAQSGAQTILALGGDGTWSNVARGMLASGRATRLALLAGGTGNDLAHATGVPAHDLDATLDIAYGRGERRIDMGEADGIAFVNCVGFGFDAEVVRESQEVRWLRGHAVYLLTAARKLFSYRGFSATVTASVGLDLDGSPPSRIGACEHHLAIIIANGARFGGGFEIAPRARIDDGVLDVVRIADTSAWRRARVFASATRGAHETHREVTRWPAREITLAFRAPPCFEADGELHQASGNDVLVRSLPRALRLAVAEG